MVFDINSLDHVLFMREALKEAERAMCEGELPIGAVIVHHDKIIGRGHAQHRQRHSRLAHAEMNVLLETASELYDFPHNNAVIYTTVEPCEMCLGAIVMSDAVNHIVFGLADHWINPSMMLEMPHVKRHIRSYMGGILEEESKALWLQSHPDLLDLLHNGRTMGKEWGHS